MRTDLGPFGGTFVASPKISVPGPGMAIGVFLAVTWDQRLRDRRGVVSLTGR